MRIIHDVFTNDVPIFLTARTDDEGKVVADSIKMHPIIECPESNQFIILEPLPFDNMVEMMPRLEKYNDNETS